MLETIIKTKIEELKHFSSPVPIETKQKRSLRDALIHPKRKIGLIAEVKKASPSKGTFKETINPTDIASRYERAGADAISVLTDRTFFKGNREYLKAIKSVVNIPVLRKDFIIDERQLEESVQIGADAILLIAAALPPNKLYDFYRQASGLGLECLVEVHNREELERLLDVFQPQILGINNRNLNTFVTTIATTLRLLPFLPKDSVVVSESGFKTNEDVSRILPFGVNGILVGEALMTAASPEEGIYRLLGGESE
ncbi:MAG: indole-3-glycerol phosphate synthase TrpC [Tuberibacillus sp.]